MPQLCASYIGYGAKSGQSIITSAVQLIVRVRTLAQPALPQEKLERFVTDKIKGYILTDGHLLDLIKQSNEAFDVADNKRKERVEIIDKEIEQWESRLERLYDFVETRKIEPDRMGQRIAEVQDKLNLMRQTKLDIENGMTRIKPRILTRKNTLVCG